MGRRLGYVTVMVLALALSSCGYQARSGEVSPDILESSSTSFSTPEQAFLNELVAAGLPVSQSGVDSANSTSMFVELASPSAGKYGSTDLFAAYVETFRRTAIARSHGLDVKRLRIDCVNSQGALLLTADVPADESWSISSSWAAAPALSQREIEEVLRNGVTSAAAESVDSTLSMTSDGGNYRAVTITAVAEDPSDVRKQATELRPAVAESVRFLNAKGAQIALVWIKIAGKSGETLHLSWLDYQFAREGYWTDPSVPETQSGGWLAPLAPGVEEGP